ncbi:MAG: hypothetical protein ABIF19_09185 [Planctomycetota bacterium]
MTVAVSDIENRVRQRTRRDNTADLTSARLTEILQEAVKEISRILLCLEASTTGTLSSSTNTITAPSGMVESEAAIDELYLDTDLLDPITFEEWRAGNVRGYAYRDGTIYVSPTPDNDKSYTLYYRKYHGTLSTNLEFDDDLKTAVFWLGCKKVYEDYELDDMANVAGVKYEQQININGPVEAVATSMRTVRE